MWVWRMAVLSAETLAGDLKTQVPSPRCDPSFRDQVAKIPTLLPEHLYFSEEVFRGGESVFRSNLCLEKKGLFFVRYLNLYKKC